MFSAGFPVPDPEDTAAIRRAYKWETTPMRKPGGFFFPSFFFLSFPPSVRGIIG